MKPALPVQKESLYVFDSKLGRKRRHDPFFAQHAQTVGMAHKDDFCVTPTKAKRGYLAQRSKTGKLSSSDSMIITSTIIRSEEETVSDQLSDLIIDEIDVKWLEAIFN